MYSHKENNGSNELVIIILYKMNLTTRNERTTKTKAENVFQKNVTLEVWKDIGIVSTIRVCLNILQNSIKYPLRKWKNVETNFTQYNEWWYWCNTFWCVRSPWESWKEKLITYWWWECFFLLLKWGGLAPKREKN